MEPKYQVLGNKQLPWNEITYNSETTSYGHLCDFFLRSPHYYGHFFWPPGKTDTFSCKKNDGQFFFHGPLVTVLTGFQCISSKSFSATSYCSHVNCRESGLGKRRGPGKECRLPG